MIFDITEQDLAEVVAITYKMALEAAPVEGVDLQDLFYFVESSIKSNDHYNIAFKENGKILGVLSLSFVPFKWNTKHLQALEECFHSDPNLPPYKKAKVMIALLEAAEKKCKELDINSLIIGVMSNTNFDKFFERKGYILEEKIYIKEF